MAPGGQSRGKPFTADIFASEHDSANGIIVGQHADDDVAAKHPRDIQRRVETELRQPVHLVLIADIGDHAMSGGRQVCRHRRAHAPETDEADFAPGLLRIVCSEASGLP
jgi:hypothetical protein